MITLLFILLSILLSSIGLFWIFKYKSKVKIFKYQSFFHKSILIMVLTNLSWWFYFIVQTVIWKLVVLNDISYENNGGNMSGANVSNLCAETYNNYSNNFSYLLLFFYLILFILGLAYKIKAPNFFVHYNKKTCTIWIIISIIFVIISFFISIIMFVVIEGFNVQSLIG